MVLNRAIIYLLISCMSTFVLAQEKQTEKPEVKIGGALRFNYNYSTWKKAQKQRGGDFGFDVFRLNTKAKYKGIKLNAEYRLYSQGFGGGMLKHGWIGYDLSDKNNLQLGLTQVPFGITTYNSHNWFASINLYLGLEDDHDMGVKFTHKGEKIDYALAFFKNAEELRFGNTSDVSDSRYSYDVASIDLNGDGNLNLRNKEVNQFNAKMSYKLSKGNTKHKFGTSLEYGGLFNLDTQKMGNHYALAAHYKLKSGPFDLKAQISKYKYKAKNLPGETTDVIAMTAYGAPYLTAAEATSYTLGAAYTIPVKWKPISSLQIYNDFGYVAKVGKDFQDTLMNVTGVLVTAGNVYTYFDFVAGKNQPWLGPIWTNALAEGSPSANWEMRFNINIGYYF